MSRFYMYVQYIQVLCKSGKKEGKKKRKKEKGIFSYPKEKKSEKEKEASIPFIHSS